MHSNSRFQRTMLIGLVFPAVDAWRLGIQPRQEKSLNAWAATTHSPSWLTTSSTPRFRQAV